MKLNRLSNTNYNDIPLIVMAMMALFSGSSTVTVTQAFSPSSKFIRPSLVSTSAPSSSALVMIIDGREGRNGIPKNGFVTSSSNATSSTVLRYTNTIDVPPAPPLPSVEIVNPRKYPPIRKKPLEEEEVEEEKGKYYPHRQELLQTISMLPKITHAKGNYLYLEDGTPILDCLSQYGAVPLGHNHDAINGAIMEYLSQNQAGFVQPFMPEATKALSRKLCHLANTALAENKDQYDFVAFSNSGAETVEAAFKLARTKTQRTKILSATDSFHGKSFAALSATGSDRYANQHIVCDKNFDKVPLNDVDALEAALASKEYAAFIVEPVQGEGGMIPADKVYLEKAQEICAKTGTKLIFDEVQTGLGRTGSMFAKDLYGVQPDIFLLSKALGGGTYPIGAVVAKRSAYCNEFDRKHSSTFAAGGIGSTAALKTLDLLENTDILHNVRRQSKHVEIGLARLQEKFPEILSYSGKGLMWAIDFTEPEQDKVANNLSIHLWRTALSYLISGFLLNEKEILCMPFLGKTGAIRFEPALTIDEAQVEYFLNAIEDVCTILKNQRHDILVSYLIQRPTCDADIHTPFVQKHLNNPPQPPLKQGEKRRSFAFLGHLLGVDDTMKQLPPAVKAHFTEEEQRKMAEKFLSVGILEPEPTVVTEVTMTGATGVTVDGCFICTPLDPILLMKMSKQEKQYIMEEYHKAAKAQGVDHIIGLGAFTSVITRGGTQYVNDDQIYTSGSSFTALASAESLRQHASTKGDMTGMGITVIGAKGLVGRLTLMELLQHFGHTNIVGSPRSGVAVMEDVVGDCLVELAEGGYDKTCDPSSSLGKMFALLEKSEAGLGNGGSALVEHLRDLAAEHNVDLPITITTDATTVVDSTDYVLTATSEGKSFLSSDTFRPGTVIFDLARPFDFEASPDCNIEVFEGGLATWPEKTMWGDVNIAHHPAGVNLACLSETIALAMEGVEKSYSIGTIPYSEAKEVYDICIKHGFIPLYYSDEEGQHEREESAETQPLSASSS